MTTDDELIALLPGVYYMDPPDGGGVSVYEQLRRMSEDAAKRRAQTQEAPAPSAASLTVDQMDEIASATIGDYNLRQSRRLCRIVAAVTRGADMEEAIAAEYAAARAPVDGEATLDQRDKP